MAEEGFKRKLAAILNADVEGYSRLMEEDEEATIRTLTKYREIITEQVKQREGRVVDSPGDNVLAEFASVVDALKCAVQTQKEIAEQNENLPENRKMKFRIGVNLGDVAEEGDRIYGDGVNVAARIESLADPGGIYISRTAYDQVRKKLTLGYEYLGEHAVKNIDEPVRVYRVLTAPEHAGVVLGEKTAAGKKWRRLAYAAVICLIVVAGGLTAWNIYLQKSKRIETASLDKMAYPLPDKPSIAVLPFDNMSGDAEQTYIIDGLTEEIITALSKVPYLFVIARNSTFTYKGKPVKIRQIAEELGVKYVLEGSFRKAGDRVRITAKLIDATTGHHLWAERYDQDLKNIFVLQDEITMKIINALDVRLTEGELSRIPQKGTKNLQAYLKTLKAIEHFSRKNKNDNLAARQLAEEAIALDPRYSRPYIVLGYTHLFDVWSGISKSPKKSLQKALELAQKSASLDDTYACSHELMSYIYVAKRQPEKAIAEAEHCIALDPNGADGYATLGFALYVAGKPEESIALLKKAIRLNPIPPAYYLTNIGHAYRFSGQYEEAVAAFKKALHRSPNNLLAHRALIVTYFLSGRNEEGRAQAKEVLRIQPKFSFEGYVKGLQLKDQVDRKHLIDALRKAGLK